MTLALGEEARDRHVWEPHARWRKPPGAALEWLGKGRQGQGVRFYGSVWPAGVCSSVAAFRMASDLEAAPLKPHHLM